MPFSAQRRAVYEYQAASSVLDPNSYDDISSADRAVVGTSQQPKTLSHTVYYFEG